MKIKYEPENQFAARDFNRNGIRQPPDRVMFLNQYQEEAKVTATHIDEKGDGRWNGFPQGGYSALGMCGEAGEAAEKIKKLHRNILSPFGFSKVTDLPEHEADTWREIICAELGDVLWYVALCAHELGISLEEVATYNIHKLRDRQMRNVVKSEGDRR